MVQTKEWNKNNNYVIHSDGRVYSKTKKRFLKARDSNGYQSCTLQDNTRKKPVSIRLHRVIAETFCENKEPEIFKIVDHIDGNRNNNDATNLRWTDGKGNAENVGNLSFNIRTVIQYDMKDKYIATYSSASDAYKATGCSQGTITHCCGGRSKFATGKDNQRYIWKYNELFDKLEIPKDSKKISGYDGYFITKDGKVYSSHIKRFMKLQTNKDGYIRINLKKNKEKCHYSVHSLVLEAFGEKPDTSDIIEINHKDGVRSNNTLENLEYVTKSENVKHSMYVLGNKTCRKVEMYNLDTKETIKEFPSIRRAAIHVDRSSSHVGNVCQGLKRQCAGYGFRYI